MPGLCGIASVRPGRATAINLERMVSRLRHLPWQRSESFVAASEDLAVGQVSLGVIPATSRPGRWVHGEDGDGCVEVTSDSNTRDLSIQTDPFGMLPLYYYVTGDLLVFATEVRAILAHPDVPGRLDERGLADLLAFGFLLGQKTLVRDVRRLPGGWRLRFSSRSGEHREERIWDFRGLLGRAAPDPAAALERATGTFRDAVAKRCLGGVQIGVSLSGGLDSRTIMAAIDHGRHNVRTLTVDVEGGADRAIAERISRRTNGLSNHRVVENSADFFAAWPGYAREMVWLTDGMYYDEACGMMGTLDQYREAGIDVILRGHGGELARMSEAYEMRVNRHVRACRSQESLKEQLFQQMNFAVRDDALAALAPDLWPALRGAARASFEEAFLGIEPSWHIVDQVSCLYVEQYLPRQCALSLGQLRSRAEVRLPFLDQDYVAAVLGLPPQHRLTSRVHCHLLRRTNPELLRITNGNTGTWAGAPPIVQRASQKAFQLLEWLGYQRYRHVVDPEGWLRGPLYGAVSGVLSDRRAEADGYFSHSVVRKMLEDHQGRGGSNAPILLILLYVELWRRMCLEGEPWNLTEGASGSVAM